jgi:Choline dehydrogenase and related flavoproteins
MLSGNWKDRKPYYDFVIVGSGYGGAITAARIAEAQLGKSICILERGREWIPGSFPDTLDGILQATRSSANPLGLYEFLTYRDISVIKGSGLGGTSLVNANVAIMPDPEVFDLVDWPEPLSYDHLRTYYEKALAGLDAKPHPKKASFLKVQALERRAAELGLRTVPLNLTVNFDPNKKDPLGNPRAACNDCGDCVTGCNFGAKNTLYTNYLPLARKYGAEIYTQTKVEWIEKLSGGGWKVHGRYYRNNTFSERFSLTAANVILAAGSINSTEILMRSEMNGLSVSPRLGTGFSGNGDFFGLAYNGDYQTNVLGLGRSVEIPGAGCAPGPTIVAAIRYNGSLPPDRRITIEDLSFPSAYVQAAKTAFAVIRGEDTDIGDQAAELERIKRDLAPFGGNSSEGALNHTMLYLCMGFDDARGRMIFEAPWYEPDGRMRIEWDDVGRQVVFARINEELRRHARAQGATFIQNPMWTIFDTRHLVTAHPLGGCPIGEDYMHGAVDAYGRVFSGDGSVHEGLYVADGALIPSALGVNPFLTISALAEWIADRKVRELQGEAYPKRALALNIPTIDSVEVTTYSEGELEKLFRRVPCQSINLMLNSGQRVVDIESRTIRNDEYWKGFFPKGHILNAMSSAIFTGFRKQFFKTGDHYGGITSDTDGRIRARNTLKEVVLKKREGDLEPGKYILLEYTDPPWQGYYDVFKVVNENLLIGRVYIGEFPKGLRLFTFPMTRVYNFEQMTVEDHATLWRGGTVPGPQDLEGVWRMDAISNANHLAGVAYLEFRRQPDGRLESRYQLMGLLEGLVVPGFLANHFQLVDFTPFHDEIRQVTDDFMVGKYVMDLPPGISSLFPAASLGLLHVEEEPRHRFGFYYTLTRTDQATTPSNRLLEPFLNVHLPAGLGMTFDEEMVGWYWPGKGTTASQGSDRREIAARIPRQGRPDGAFQCSFKLRMTVRDLNEFIEGAAHEAGAKGTISFENFEGSPAMFEIDESRSRFHYLIRNEATGEAEMRYVLYFQTPDGRRFLFDGRKYMQKDERIGERGIREALEDFTTLYCHVSELREDGTPTTEAAGEGLLKFKTFEDIAAVQNLAGFLRSFKVTGTSDPLLQLQGQMKFFAFTAQFVQREYDPLAPEPRGLQEEVRFAVLRGASEPDYFSTRSTPELQQILRDAPTLPLEKLINTGAVRIDFAKKRIFRDSFWKGSFARDSVLGAEERLRNRISGSEAKTASTFTGGSFWKRFDRIREDGVAIGHVVNYELDWLPGKPEVRLVPYADDRRTYFQKGDNILLLTYVNEPYRIVYDTIKVIDEDSAIGVMHLGTFPDGLEFATFVMERNNYPFEKMAVEDHHAIFNDARAFVPTPQQVLGDWQGHLIFLRNPNLSLLNQFNPAALRVKFEQTPTGVSARYRFGLITSSGQPESSEEFVHITDSAMFRHELRMIDSDTMIGRWAATEPSAALLQGLQQHLEPAGNRFVFYYLLTRA